MREVADPTPGGNFVASRPQPTGYSVAVLALATLSVILSTVAWVGLYDELPIHSKRARLAFGGLSLLVALGLALGALYLSHVRAQRRISRFTYRELHERLQLGVNRPSDVQDRWTTAGSWLAWLALLAVGWPVLVLLVEMGVGAQRTGTVSHLMEAIEASEGGSATGATRQSSTAIRSSTRLKTSAPTSNATAAATHV
jgi:hypothetical protein